MQPLYSVVSDRLTENAKGVCVNPSLLGASNGAIEMKKEFREEKLLTVRLGEGGGSQMEKGKTGPIPDVNEVTNLTL